MKRLLIIPAKSNSRRVKNKNFKFFFGKPIIEYSLQIAKQSKLFDKIHVSTESKRIVKKLEKKIKIEFLRNKKLTKNNVGVLDVLKEDYKKFEDKGYKFDEVWCMSACSPLLEKSDLINASKFFDKVKKPVLSVSKFPAPIEWSLILKKNKKINFINNSKIHLDSKKFDNKFFDTGLFAIFPSKFLKKINKNNFYKNIFGFEISRNKAVDVDEKDDWEFMKYLYRKKIK